MEDNKRKQPSGSKGSKSADKANKVPTAKQPLPLQSFRAENMRKFNLVSGLSELAQLVRANEAWAYYLIASISYMDLRAAGMNYIKLPQNSPIGVQRDKAGAIIGIADNVNKQKLNSKDVAKLVCLYNQQRQGALMTVMDEFEAGGPIPGFIIPYGELEVWTEDVKQAGKETVAVTGRRMYTANKNLITVVTPAQVLNLLDLKLLKLNAFPGLLRSLNQAVRKNPSFDPSGVTTLETAAAQLITNLPESQQKFFHEMIAAISDGSDLTERIKAFVSCPSLNFASRLQLPRIVTKQLFSADGKSVQRKELSKLAPGDLVLTQLMTFDQSYYRTALKPDMLVYLAGPQYKVKVGKNKFKPFKEDGQLLVSLLRKVIQGRDEDLHSGKAIAEIDGGDDEGEEDLEVV